MSIDSIVDEIEHMTVTELVALANTLRNRLGVTMMPLVQQTYPVSPSRVADTVDYEPTTYDVWIMDAKDDRVRVIKMVREMTGMGLKESKEFVDNLPQVISWDVDITDAQATVGEFANIGADAIWKIHQPVLAVTA